MENVLAQTADSALLELGPTLRARQTYLAKLLHAFSIEPEEFAVLTIDSIISTTNKPLVSGRLINSGIFAMAAAHCLTAISIGRRSSTPWSADDLGPYADAVLVLANWLSRRDADPAEVVSKGMPRGEVSIEWGAECQALLQQARRKSSPAWQHVLAFERWVKGVNSLIPNTARWLYAVGGFIAGALLAWLLKL